MPNSTHPLRGDLYTPHNEEIIQLLNRMREVHKTWRDVAFITGTRLKVLRRLRTVEAHKAVSMKLLDRLITTTGVGDINDYVWFTADDLVAMGVWDKPAEPVDSFPTEWKEKRRGKR